MTTTLETLVRNMAATVEGLKSTVEAHSTRLDETRADAREARDATTKLTERLVTQDMPAEVARLRAQVEAGFVAARSDLVNAMDKSTGETRTGFAKVDAAFARVDSDMGAHNKRIQDLEDWRRELIGAGGVFNWLAKNAPWLITILTVIAAFVFGHAHKIP